MQDANKVNDMPHINTLTAEESARVFAMYFGEEIQYARHDEGSIEPRQVGRVLDAQCLLTLLELSDISGVENHITSVRLLLRPLSALSDEDAVEVARILCFRGDNVPAQVRDLFTQQDSWLRKNTDCFKFLSAAQHLIAQGYDLPLFITPGHPDNGKTAIEIGLAIAKEAAHE